MTTPSFHELEQLSAYLDGNLSLAERTRLAARLAAEPELRTALEKLRQTRALLRRTPKRRAPRSFALTSKLTGVRPPTPRVVPALTWASAVALLLFFFTFATHLTSQVAFSPMAAAPKAVAPALSSGNDNGTNESPQASSLNPAATPTPAALLLAPQATSEVAVTAPPAGLRVVPQPPVPAPAAPTPAFPLSLLQIGLIALAVLTGLLAALILWSGRRAFYRQANREQKEK